VTGSDLTTARGRQRTARMLSRELAPVRNGGGGGFRGAGWDRSLVLSLAKRPMVGHPEGGRNKKVGKDGVALYRE
jgi:hypothetical protein